MRPAFPRWLLRSGLLLVIGVVALTGSLTLRGQTQRSVWDGVYTEAQTRRGEPLYAAHCASCHGAAMTGLESAPALLGDTFNATWEGAPLSDLFDRIRTTMPQSRPGSLSRAQNVDVLAYMLQVAKYPAGDRELDPQGLEGIIYRTYRP